MSLMQILHHACGRQLETYRELGFKYASSGVLASPHAYRHSRLFTDRALLASFRYKLARCAILYRVQAWSLYP